MGIARFDHAVIPTSQPDALIEFYERLGFTAVGADEWRAGKARAFALALGDSKINVHPPDVWSSGQFMLRGPTAVPGCGDFCFVWDGSLDDLKAMLSRAQAEVIEGPVMRVGGKSVGTAHGTSFYIRDPDQNLLEFIVYS